MKALLSIGGETVSVLLDTTEEKIEEEKRVLRKTYPREHITIKRKEINGKTRYGKTR